jgi:hypothetical protein
MDLVEKCRLKARGMIAELFRNFHDHVRRSHEASRDRRFLLFYLSVLAKNYFRSHGTIAGLLPERPSAYVVPLAHD